MKIVVAENVKEMGRKAAETGAAIIRDAIAKKGAATIIVATGASQFTVLEALIEAPGIDWSKVTGFHLDEYIGISIEHPASFRKYLKERFVDKVPLKQFNYVNGEAVDPKAECKRLGELIKSFPVDVAFIGIGENAHIAFNDPPADFDTEEPYLVVTLDEACRKQQHGEGWFKTMDDVPKLAISMSVKHILKSANIMCSVPDQRKAEAVKDSVEGPIVNTAPGSILQKHATTTLFLDPPAASLLKSK